MTSRNASNKPGRSDTPRSGEHRLEQALDALGKETPTLGMEQMRQRVERAARSGSTHPAGGWKHIMTRKLFNLKTATAVGLLGLVGACSVPIEAEEETGRQFVIRTSDPTAVLAELRSGTWQVDDLKIWEQESGEKLVLATLLDPGDQAESHFRSLDGVLDLENTPTTETVSRSIFGRMANSLFEVRVNTTGMSTDQINTAINEQLANQGFPGTVQVTRDGENGRVEVEVDPGQLEGNGQVMITLDEDETVDADGNNRLSRMHMKVGSGMADQFSADMTDAQIRELVISQLKKDGVNPDDASISISRIPATDGGEGKVKVGVEVEQRRQQTR